MTTIATTGLRQTATSAVITSSRAAHRAPHTLLLSRTSTLVAWAGLMVAAFHPPHGFGVPICWFNATSGAPCWGCGLSRSFSCFARGMFAEGWFYHPFGPVLMAVLLGIVAISLLPSRLRHRPAAVLDRFPRITLTGYVALVTSFVTFGTLRALHHLLG